MGKKWWTDWPFWIVLAGMFVAGAIAWPNVPDRMPVHWGLNGEANRYGGRFEGVWLLPLLALGLYILMRVAPRADPGRANYALFGGAYAVLRFAVLLLLAGIYALALLSATGHGLNMARIVPILIGGLLIALGSVMGKLRPNWFVGIRTPWTLSSARSWGKTHRLGGWLFLGIGLLMVLGGIVGLPNLIPITLGALVAALVVLLVYSYLIWRQDQGAVPPAGSQPAEEV
jgi:uncharacterized membrane protein